MAVLQWVREHGPGNSSAANAGPLEVMQWLRENDVAGEVWNDDYVRRFAAGPRKQEVLTWLVDSVLREEPQMEAPACCPTWPL